MKTTCVHSCKEVCNALEVAEKYEREAIREYKQFAEKCDYPDVRVLLEDLINERKASLRLLEEKRAMLAAKFNVLDDITASFV